MLKCVTHTPHIRLAGLFGRVSRPLLPCIYVGLFGRVSRPLLPCMYASLFGRVSRPLLPCMYAGLFGLPPPDSVHLLFVLIILSILNVNKYLQRS